MNSGAYGDAAAALYDDAFSPPVRSEMIDFLVKLAGGGSVLDVGAGTGRVAIPMARAGCPVVAIDISERMCTVLKAKTADLGIECLRQDVTEQCPPGRHELAICLFNTFYMLGDSSAQSRALGNIARCLKPDACLLIEAFLPDTTRFGARGEFMRLRSVTPDSVVLQFSMHDAENRRIYAQDVILRNGEVKLIPSTMHYLWPAQLDEMASAAGLELDQRCSDWKWGQPVSTSTSNVVSVYRKVAGA